MSGITAGFAESPGQRPSRRLTPLCLPATNPLVVEPQLSSAPARFADAGTGVGAERNVRADQRDGRAARYVLMLKAWRRRKRCTARKSTRQPIRTGCHL